MLYYIILYYIILYYIILYYIILYYIILYYIILYYITTVIIIILNVIKVCTWKNEKTLPRTQGVRNLPHLSQGSSETRQLWDKVTL